MKFGSSNITSVKLGSASVDKIYVGTNQIYPVSSPAPGPYTPPDYATSGIQMYYNPEDPTSYAGSGTTLTDLSGNGYDATLVNGPSFASSYFTLDGVDDYIASPNMVSSFNSTTSFTVEVWYSPNYTVQGDGGTVLQESGADTPSTSWYYALMEHRKAQFGSLSYDYAGIWKGSYTAINPLITIGNDVWRQQVLTYNGINGIIYTNGTNAKSVATSRSTPWNDPSNYGYYLMIGAGSATQQSGAGANNFTGKIGIVRAYNRALSSTEVLQNYNGAKAIYGL